MYFSKIVFGLASMASLVSAVAAPSQIETGLEERTASFSCPNKMSYCPWTKSCSCPPGQYLDQNKGVCVGKTTTGCWPKPKPDVYGSVDVKLGAYCACSPYKIVKYDANHKYCQASLNNVVFLAPLEIDAEIKLYAGLEIDVNAKISVALKSTCAGLAGLYLESVLDAVALFNTNNYGLAVSPTGIIGGVVASLLAQVKGLACLLGLANCHYDCVSYCAKGCHNFVDVKGQIGGFISGLVGFCVLPDILLIVGGAGKIITVTVEGLLCIVGNILKALLSTFNCGCH